MHLYTFFSARRYITLTACVKVRIGSPKRLGINKFVHTKVLQEVKIFRNFFFEQLYKGWTVVVYLIAVFSVASDGATTERQI